MPWVGRPEQSTKRTPRDCARINVSKVRGVMILSELVSVPSRSNAMRRKGEVRGWDID